MAFISWTLKHPQATAAHLGYIPMYFPDDDPRPAVEQINERYGPVGGQWRPQEGWKMGETQITYPGDPPRALVAEARLLSGEVLRLYSGGRVAVVQPDGSFEVGVMD